MGLLFWVIIIVLLLGGVGSAPHWGYLPQSYGYRPVIGLGTAVLVLLLLYMLGYIR